MYEQIVANVTRALIEEMKSIPDNPSVKIRVLSGIAIITNEQTGKKMQLQLAVVRDPELFTNEGEINREESTVFEKPNQS